MDNTQVPANLLANQVSMIEDYHNAQQQAPQPPQAPIMPQQAQQVPQAPVMSQQTPQQPQQAEASIIAQLQAQNAALIEQNNSLNAQVVRMVQNGAQFSQQPQQPQQTPQVGQNWAVQPNAGQYPPIYGGNDYMPASLAQNVDVSLESLASEIGKPASNEK